MYEDFRLRIFLEVASQGSFTRAAHHIGITQPAVSQNIADLEREFGIPLFIRSKAAATLTEQGRTFKAYAERIISEYDELNIIFKNFEAIKSCRSIRLAVQDGLLPRVAADLLPYLRGVNPDLVIEVVPDAVEAGSSVPGADLTLRLSATGGLEALPSATFARHPLWPLVRRCLTSSRKSLA